MAHSVTTSPASEHVIPVQEQAGTPSLQPWKLLAAENASQLLTAPFSSSSACTARGRQGGPQTLLDLSLAGSAARRELRAESVSLTVRGLHRGLAGAQGFGGQDEDGHGDCGVQQPDHGGWRRQGRSGSSQSPRRGRWGLGPPSCRAE